MWSKKTSFFLLDRVLANTVFFSLISYHINWSKWTHKNGNCFKVEYNPDIAVILGCFSVLIINPQETKSMLRFTLESCVFTLDCQLMSKCVWKSRWGWYHGVEIWGSFLGPYVMIPKIKIIIITTNTFWVLIMPRH